MARLLISAGAPITKSTPVDIYQAPIDEHFALNELLFEHVWTPNTSGNYGELALPHIVTNHPLLRWFLDHGADPNRGRQLYTRGPDDGPDDWCQALEYAASEGDIVAVRMLLDAGALIKNGAPLYRDAGACTLGKNFHTNEVVPTKEFDTRMIPIMELLVERGADVNQLENSRHMTFRYALNYAVLAGAVERVRWLLEHGANPENVGRGSNAISLSKMWKREEIMKVVEEGVVARRWVKDVPKTKTEPEPEPADR